MKIEERGVLPEQPGGGTRQSPLTEHNRAGLRRQLAAAYLRLLTQLRHSTTNCLCRVFCEPARFEPMTQETRWSRCDVIIMLHVVSVVAAF